MMFILSLCLCLAAAPLGYADDTTLANSSSVSESSTIVIDPTSIPTTAEPTTDAPTTAQSTTTASVASESTIEVTTSAAPVEPTTQTVNVTRTGIDTKLWEQVRDILKHFQNPDPVGLPGQTILEDPLSVPNQTTSFGLGYAYFYNMTVHGLSNFTLESVNTHLDDLEVYTMIKMKKVVILGNCTVDHGFGLSNKGPFNITLRNVTAEGTVYLVVNPNGTLQANRSVSDMNYEELTVSTKSGGVVETALSVVGSALLAALRPAMLAQIDERIGREVNAQLQNAPAFPKIVERSPVDLAINEGRRLVRQHYEPFQINKILEHDSQFLAVSLGPVNVSGLSNFARVGRVTLQMRNGTIVIGLRMITGRLFGHGQFSYDFGKVGAPRQGAANFSIAHLQFEARVNQSLDFRKKPVLDDLQLETGRILVQLDGKGRLDYLLETALDLLPQMFRYIIIDALEEPIKQVIQKQVLDKLDVNELFDQNFLQMVQSVLYA